MVQNLDIRANCSGLAYCRYSRQGIAPKTEGEHGREPKQVDLGFNDGIAVNDDPCVTKDPPLHPSEPNDERWIRASARQHAIEQEAPLKAVTIRQAG